MASPEAPASVDDEGSAWARSLLALALIVFIVGVSVALAYRWSPPERDAAEQVQAAVETAFERGQVRASAFSSERWTELHAFGPMATEGVVRLRIGRLDLGDDFSRVGPDERLLVFTDAEKVVQMARMPAQAVETACMAAGLPDGVPPDVPIRIQTVVVDDRQVLVAAPAAASPWLRGCLDSLPAE